MCFYRRLVFLRQIRVFVADACQIIPSFVNAIEKATTPTLQSFHVQQLAAVVGIVRQHIRKYATELNGMVKTLWSKSHLRSALVKLVENLTRALDTEFRPFLPTIMPLILEVFDDPTADSAQRDILLAIVSIGANIEDYLHLVVPAICKPLESDEALPLIKTSAVRAVHGLLVRVNLTDHAARLILPIVRNLDVHDGELRGAIMHTLTLFLVQLKQEYVFFAPLVAKVSACCVWSARFLFSCRR